MAKRIIYVAFHETVVVQEGETPTFTPPVHEPPPQCCFKTRNPKLKWRKHQLRKLGLPLSSQKMIQCPAPSSRVIGGKSYCHRHQPNQASKRINRYPKYTIDKFYDSAEWRILRFDCLIRDKHICQYCGEKAHQADHVIPRKKGGADHLSNLVAACASCNRVAGGSRFESFEAKKQWVLEHRGIPEKRPTELLNAIAKEVV